MMEPSSQEELGRRLGIVFERQVKALPDSRPDLDRLDYTMPTHRAGPSRRHLVALAAAVAAIVTAGAFTVGMLHSEAPTRTRTGAPVPDTTAPTTAPAPPSETIERPIPMTAERAQQLCEAQVRRAEGMQATSWITVGESQPVTVIVTASGFRSTDGPLYPCDDHRFAFEFSVRGPAILTLTSPARAPDAGPGAPPEPYGPGTVQATALAVGTTTIHATVTDPKTGAVIAAADQTVTVSTVSR